MSFILQVIVKNMLSKLEEEEPGITRLSFYSTSIEYLEHWTGQFEDIEVCQWILLSPLLTWPEVEGTLDFILKNKPDFKIIMMVNVLMKYSA